MSEKWTVNRLSDETGMDRRTIKKLLANTEPCDVDGKSEFYRLRDFIEALTQDLRSGSGTLEAEQTRLTAAKADREEIARARDRNEVIEVDTVLAVLENRFVSMRRSVLTAEKLTEAEKDSMLSELKRLVVDEFVEQREFDKGTAAESGDAVHSARKAQDK